MQLAKLHDVANHAFTSDRSYDALQARAGNSEGRMGLGSDRANLSCVSSSPTAARRHDPNGSAPGVPRRLVIRAMLLGMSVQAAGRSCRRASISNTTPISSSSGGSARTVASSPAGGQHRDAVHVQFTPGQLHVMHAQHRDNRRAERSGKLLGLPPHGCQHPTHRVAVVPRRLVHAEGDGAMPGFGVDQEHPRAGRSAGGRRWRNWLGWLRRAGHPCGRRHARRRRCRAASGDGPARSQARSLRKAEQSTHEPT
jgi:hypothetical protein